MKKVKSKVMKSKNHATLSFSQSNDGVDPDSDWEF